MRLTVPHLPRSRDHHAALRRVMAYLAALLQRLRSTRVKARLWPRPGFETLKT
jgi:hypothetical protein